MRAERRSTIRRDSSGFGFRYPVEKDRTRGIVGLGVGYLNLDTRKVRQLRKHGVCEV